LCTKCWEKKKVLFLYVIIFVRFTFRDFFTFREKKGVILYDFSQAVFIYCTYSMLLRFNSSTYEIDIFF
jgi:hypothetical protein